ncbi:MAG TPA: hypothetical protein PKB06_13140 [Actinotalea sp.]|nr:hypothetical protein [Actinotalea sp.]
MEPHRVVNREQPASTPTSPMGDVPVIARVVWSDGLEEWRPARALRWTRTHVMVGRHESEEVWVWLRAGDVMRSVSWFVAPSRTSSGPGRR